MNIADFLRLVETLAPTRRDLKPHPYDSGEKLYARFLRRFLTLDRTAVQIATDGWLRKIYRRSNGVDLGAFYIVPFNNYFNRKPLALDQFFHDWVVNSNNPNEINGADFFAFMTDGKTVIGFCTDLRDAGGNPFIAVAQKGRRVVTDLTFVASRIYRLLDHMAGQLTAGEPLSFSAGPEYWRAHDPALDASYSSNQIMEYKLRVLWNDESALFRQYAAAAQP